MRACSMQARPLGRASNAGCRAWLYVVRGAVRANGVRLSEGDGAAIENEARIAIAAPEHSELLLFDLP
jgi:quercetin 2,3-dioxygenase